MPHSPEPQNSILSDPQQSLAALASCGAGLLLLLLIGWVAYFSPFDDFVDGSGTPLGGDYAMLYVAGQVLNEGHAAELYNDDLNQARTSALFPKLDPRSSWPFRYPPHTAWLMRPLSHLPFVASYACFGLLMLASIGTSLKLLAATFDIPLEWRRPVLWAAIGWPLVFECLAGGQLSPVALLLLTGTLYAIRYDKLYVAGFLLGLSAYKPNVLALVAIGMIVAKPRILPGIALAAIPTALICWLAAGVDGIADYLQLAQSLSTSTWQLETPFWKVHGLAPLLDGMWPGHGKRVALWIGIVMAVSIGWRWRILGGWLPCAALVITNALFNPYVPIYDMLLVMVAVFCSVASQSPIPSSEGVSPWMAGGILLVYFGPHLSQTLSRAMGIQIFPVILLGFLIWQLTRLAQTKAGAVQLPLGRHVPA